MSQLGPWQPIYLTAGIAIVAAAIWLQWAKKYTQWKRPQQDRELAGWLWRWFTALPWGPVRAAATIAVVGLEPWRSGAATTPASYAAWGTGLTVGLCVAAVALTHLTVKRLFWDEWVLPLHQAICAELTGKEMEQAGWSPDDRRLSSRIKIARDWQHHKRRGRSSSHNGILVKFPLSLRLNETHLDALRDIIIDVLGLRDVDHRWYKTGRFSIVQFTPARVVPAVARFRNPDIRTAIETALTALPSAPVLALGRGDAPIAIDIDAEAPHILISAGTIGGKSMTVRSIVGQLLWADPEAVAVIADKKEFSQRGLAAVPGVAYARSDEEINAALVAVWDEVQRRNAVCRDIPLGQPLPKFPRIVLGLEEMNVTTKTLNSWWRRNQGSRAGMAPGIYALDNILCMGRAVRTNVVLDAQQANAKTTGGGEGRANIAVRILAEYGQREWDMLAHGAEYIPAVSHKVQPGWCVIIHGRSVEEGQRIKISDEQVHAWLTGRANGSRTKNLEAVLRELPPSSEHVGQEDHGDQQSADHTDPAGQGVEDDEFHGDQHVRTHGSDPEEQSAYSVDAPVDEDGSRDQESEGQAASDGGYWNQEGDGLGAHATDSITKLVDGQGVGGGVVSDGVGEESSVGGAKNPRRGGVIPGAAAATTATRTVHPQTHSQSRSGLFTPGGRVPSTQGVPVGGITDGTVDEVDYVTLRQLVEDGTVPLTLPTLRKASQQPGFPPRIMMPGGYRYSRRAVAEWFEDRPRRRKLREKGRPVIYFIVGGGVPYPGGQVKIGYTARPIKERVKELANRTKDVVKLIDVEAPLPGERLPDKDYHDRFARYAVHPYDESSELFWIRGELAEFLGIREEVSA
jgi:hypothetical protein